MFVKTIQDALESYFKFSIPTLLLKGDTFINIANSIPMHWTNDSPDKKDGMKSDVLYLFEAVNSPNILEKLGHNKSIEEMIYVDGAVLTRISRNNQSRGSLQKLIGTDIYQHITIRNINTAIKLSKLIGN